MRTKLSTKKKYLVGGATILTMIYIVFFIPLPFVSVLWEENIHRHRMHKDINRRIIGLHEDEIVVMLGEPEPGWRTLVYRLRPPNHSHSWNALIIFFDENNIAINTITANPIHVLSL